MEDELKLCSRQRAQCVQRPRGTSEGAIGGASGSSLFSTMASRALLQVVLPLAGAGCKGSREASWLRRVAVHPRAWGGSLGSNEEDCPCTLKHRWDEDRRQIDRGEPRRVAREPTPSTIDAMPVKSSRKQRRCSLWRVTVSRECERQVLL